MARLITSDDPEWDSESDDADDPLEEALSFFETVRAVGRYYQVLWPDVRDRTAEHWKAGLALTLLFGVLGPPTLWILQGRENVPIADLIWAAVIPIAVVGAGALAWTVVAASARQHRREMRLVAILLQGQVEQRYELDALRAKGDRRDALGFLLAQGEAIRENLWQAIRFRRTDYDSGIAQYQAWLKATQDFLFDAFDKAEAALFISIGDVPEPAPPAGEAPDYVFDTHSRLVRHLTRLRELILREQRESGG